MTEDQYEASVELTIKVQFLAEHGSVAVRDKVHEQMARMGVDLTDILLVLKRCKRMCLKYFSGCNTVYGETLDGVNLFVIINISERNCLIEIVKVWLDDE